MKYVRVIARLDIKGSYLIKGIQLEGLRKLGDPNVFAQKYYEDGIDELLYMDCVASLYQRDNILNIVRKTTENVFVPITVGGGIRTIENVRNTLRAGADKIAINTGAIENPHLISEVAKKFGSQCMVLSIDAKRTQIGKWEVLYNNGREKTGRDVIEWAKYGFTLGAGEILLTSVDQEGTTQGLDCELIRAVTETVPIPVIASGGVGSLNNILKGFKEGRPDAVAVAHMLHYGKLNTHQIRTHLEENGIPVRRMV